jgi:predicted cupin superfamily sugar epimerase
MTRTLTVKNLINLLRLKPLDIEGGFFRRTYTANKKHEPAGQSIASAIYYLITPDSWSSLHQISSDEMFHFYYGDPVNMLLLHENGSGEIVTLSNQPGKDFNPQQLVPKNTWQGARLQKGGQFALLGTTVFPAFEYENFRKGDAATLIEQYPEFAQMIKHINNQI